MDKDGLTELFERISTLPPAHKAEALKMIFCIAKSLESTATHQFTAAAEWLEKAEHARDDYILSSDLIMDMIGENNRK